MAEREKEEEGGGDKVSLTHSEKEELEKRGSLVEGEEGEKEGLTSLEGSLQWQGPGRKLASSCGVGFLFIYKSFLFVSVSLHPKSESTRAEDLTAVAKCGEEKKSNLLSASLSFFVGTQ